MTQLRGQLLRIPEAAEFLGISRSKLYDLIARQNIQVVRIDGAVRVPADALEDYIERLRAGDQGEAMR